MAPMKEQSTLAAPVRRNLTKREVMALTGHTDEKAFLVFVHREGFPHIKINPRLLMFPPAAVQDWLDRRTVGKAGR